MSSMFSRCTSLNKQLTLNTYKVKDMEFMFDGCVSLNQELTLATPELLTAKCMFRGCVSLNSYISLDTRNVRTMDFMFADCVSFDQDLSRLSISSAVSMVGMFAGCTSLSHEAKFAGSETRVGKVLQGGMYVGTAVQERKKNEAIFSLTAAPVGQMRTAASAAFGRQLGRSWEYWVGANGSVSRPALPYFRRQA
jgi:hypothetical protein